MFGKLKSVLNNKKVLFTTLFMLMAISCSALLVFVFQNKQQRQLSVANLETSIADIPQLDNQEISLSFGGGSGNKNKISATASATADDIPASNGKWRNDAGDLKNSISLSDVSYNAQLIFLWKYVGTESSAEGVVYVDKDGGNSYVSYSIEGCESYTFVPNPGYKFENIKITGNDGSCETIWWRSADYGGGNETKEPTILGSGNGDSPQRVCILNVKDYMTFTDGNGGLLGSLFAKNTLTITAETTEIQYSISGYRYSETTNAYDKLSTTFTIGSDDTNLHALASGQFWGISEDYAKTSKTTYNTNYTVKRTLTGSKIQIETSDDSVKIVLKYSGSYEIGGKKYYVVTSIVKGSYGNFNQLEDNPLIRAYVPRTYTATIDNSATLNSYHNLVADKSDLIGVYSAGDENDDETKATIKIKQIGTAATDTRNFATNAGRAFWKESEWSQASVASEASDYNDCLNNKYYVFCYGYEVASWTISVVGNSTDYTVTYSNEKWNISGTKCKADYTLGGLATALDNYFGFSSGVVSVTLTPTWVAAKINPIADNIETSTIDYGQGYEIEVESEPVDQKLACFTTGVEDELVAKSGTFNYIALTTYEYDESEKKYNLELAPKFLNKIYPVELFFDEEDAVVVDPTNNLPEIINTYYSGGYVNINSDTLSISAGKPAVYDIETEHVGTSFSKLPSHSSGLIEDFIENDLKSYITGYERGISKDNSDDFSILKNVYYDETKLYVYMVSDKDYGNLPSFGKTNYDLIFFESGNYVSGSYVENNKLFKTDKYNVSDHQITANMETGTEEPNNYDIGSKWKYTDGLVMRAKFFRQYYYLELKTVLAEGNINGLYGYAVVNIDDNIDNDNDRTYVAVYNADGVKFYYVGEYGTLKDFNFNNKNNSYLNIENNSKLKVYANSVITITAIDQSGDKDAVLYDADGSFDQMLGFRFKEIIPISTLNSFVSADEEDSSDIYKTTFSANGRTALTLTATINFENILYDFKSVLRDLDTNNEGNNASYAGGLSLVHPNGSSVGCQIEMSGLKRDDTGNYTITYSAEVGYEFDSPAVTLGGSSIVGGWGNSVFDNSAQTYKFKLNTDWLKAFYILIGSTAYETDVATATDMGIIYVNVKAYEFTLKAELYTDINSQTKVDLSETYPFDIKTFKLIEGKTDFTVKVEEYTTPDESIGEIIEVNGTKYALISSRLHYRANLTMADVSQNCYYAYPFTLASDNSLLNKSIGFGQDRLEKMVIDYSDSKIVTNRTIYIALEVKSIYTIEVKDSIEDGYVDPYIERNATISNNSNEKLKNYVVVGVGEIKTLYTYAGLDNKIEIIASNCYESVSCYLNNVIISQDSDFAVTRDSTLVIKYVPIKLKVDYEYYYKGALTKLEDLPAGLKVNTFVATPNNNINYGQEINVNYDVLGDYITTLKVNGFDVVDNKYIINQVDYTKALEYGKKDDSYLIKVQLWFEDIPTSSLTIEFATSLQTPYDVNNINTKNTAKVFASGEEITAVDGQYTIIAGKEVIIQIELDTGYKFNGVLHNGNNAGLTANADGRIVLTSSFNISTDNGLYKILLSKDEVVTTLTIDKSDKSRTDYEKIYSISSDDKTTTKTDSADSTIQTLSLYLGKVVKLKFDETQIKTERLDYFYYLDKSNNEVKLELGVNITEQSGVYLFEITDEVLESLLINSGVYSLNFGVKIVLRYKVEYEVKGENYLRSDILFGTEITSANCSSSIEIEGAQVNYLYLNTETKELFKCIGANRWEIVTDVSVKSGTQINQDNYSSTIVVSGANVGDYYFNTDSMYLFKCYETNKWEIVKKCIDPFVSGTYVDVGTNVVFNFALKEANNYTIKLSGNGSIQNLAHCIDYVLNVNANCNLTFTISPVELTPNLTVGEYSSLTDLAGNNLTNIESVGLVGVNNSTSSYNTQQTITIKLTDTERDLYRIKISDEYTLDLTNPGIDYENGAEITVKNTTFTIKKVGERIHISYTIVEIVDFTVEYRDIKSISGIIS